jgi:2-phospho-L-lactate/phosphoenolpyruvate guanylyltransferase
MSVWAIIPLKSPHSAKSRLSGVLDDSQRLRLFYLIARRVIEAALVTPGINGVSVVTASNAVMDFSTNLGAQCLRLGHDHGTAEACSSALEKLPAYCVKRVLFIAGDIPLISSSVLAPFVALLDRSPLIAIAGDRRRIGTNALLCAPGDIVPLCFGDDSFSRHVKEATRLGVATHIVNSAPLALDIDEPKDLDAWHRLMVASGEPIDEELRDLFAAREKAISR